MLPTRLPRVAVVALATLAIACGDLTRPKASTPNLQLNYSVYAMTGVPVGVTNAINFFAGPARVDAAFSFDVTLDIDPSGKIFVYQSAVLMVGYGYGYFRAKDILWMGLLMSIVDSLLLLLLVPYYWPLIGIK